MKACRECGRPLDEGGLTNCDKPGCDRDRSLFWFRVEEARERLDLEAVAKMERGIMPESFEPSGPGVVALAELLMKALRQNQELVSKLRQ